MLEQYQEIYAKIYYADYTVEGIGRAIVTPNGKLNAVWWKEDWHKEDKDEAATFCANDGDCYFILGPLGKILYE